MHETPLRPALTAPPQAPAVRRDLRQEPADGATDLGAEAARSACADLTGPRYELCHALQEG